MRKKFVHQIFWRTKSKFIKIIVIFFYSHNITGLNDSALKPLSVIFPDACSKSLIKAGCKCTHKDVNVFIKDNGCVSLNNVQVFLLSIFKIFLIAGEFLYC